MQLKTLSRLIAQFRDAGSNQNRIRRIRRRAATQGRDVRLQVADAISGGLLEELESRVLLAGDPNTANLTSGSLVISDLVGDNDSFLLTRSGSDLVITVGAGSTISTNAGVGDGTNSVAIPIASITAGVTVDAGIGNDSVTLDFTGDINFPAGVTIVGGAGTDTVNLNSDITFASASSLVVTAESVTTAAGVDLTTSGTGAITFTADDVTLNSTGTLVTPNTVTLTPQTASRTINLGTETAGSLSLTDTELDTISAGTIQIGNTNSGVITVSAAITSNRNLSLTTGSGGAVSTGGSLGTTGSTITLNTTGPIGTSANRIQFADNTTTTQQNVVIGSINQASSVYLDGLGSLTLGNISGGIANTTIDVTARTNLVVADNATINSGTSSNSLGADLTAAGAGDNGTGTLTVSAGATVLGANLTLRGADEEISPTANVGRISSAASVSTFATGFNNPNGLAFDSSGNLYVTNYAGGLIQKVTPSGVVSTFATGIGTASFATFDSSGNLFLSNGNVISKVTSSGVVSTYSSSGFNIPVGLVFDSAGTLYVADYGSGIVSKVSTGGVRTSFVSGLTTPRGITIDGSGNLYVAAGGSVIKITPAGSTSTFASGFSITSGICIDSSGNLYVSDQSNRTISKITPGGVVSTIASVGNSPFPLAIDADGNLFSAQNVDNNVQKITLSSAANSVTIRSSLPGRQMSLGGTNTAVGGINLTDAELARLFTSSNGTITFGDTAQTGDITFTTATTATSAGASTTVIQSTAGAGKIVLDDGANTGTALNGNGGVISLTAGTGGITAPNASNGFAEISTTGATVTMNTTGPIGTAANRIQFADNTTTTQQNVVIGSTNQASSVFLDGLGSLTLGSISGGIANTTIDVTARTNLVVAASATINSGTSSNSLGADLTAASAGDNGTGTLTVNANANVVGANINLRGADQEISSTANVGSTGSSTLASAGLNYGAIFYNGNLYVPDQNGNRVLKITPAGSTTIYATGVSSPRDVAFDSVGNMYVANFAGGAGTVSIVAPGGGTGTLFASGFNGAWGLTLDASDNVYVVNSSGTTISKVTVSAPGVFSSVNHSFSTVSSGTFTVRYFADGNLYAGGGLTGGIVKISPTTGIVTPFVSAAGGFYFGLTYDSATGNLYATRNDDTVKLVTPAGTVTTFATGFSQPIGLARDSSGNLYVGNINTSSVIKIAPGATSQVTVRGSILSRPMSVGGINTAVAGINLTDTELGRISTTSTGTITFGDTAQTGDITFTTATTATTAGASTTVIQSTAGAGKIVLDDGANTGTAMNGNGGVISLTAGTGGITATAANNTSAEISTTGATVTMNTTGPIGTSANRIQFADNTTTTQQNVVIGSTSQASGVYLGGLGSLTLGAINDSTRNAAIDVTAGNQLVVTAAVSTLGGNISFAAANGVTLTGAAAAVSTVGGSTATLSQAGSDLTTNDAWRTSGVVKTRDADGDNIYGTAGYYLYGSASSQPTLVPSFATVAVAAGTLQVGPDAGYVRLDDPALTGVGPVANVSTGTRYRASQAANQEGDLVVITITQAGSFRLGVIQDNHDLTAISPLSLRVRQTTGGSADSGYLSATAERNLDGDYFFFDFVNAQVGSVYTLSGVNDGGFPSNGIYGVTFDKIQGGTYTVNADTDNDGGGAYIQNNAGSTAATGGGNVSITAADATLLGTTNAGGGRVTIVPTNSRQIDLGTNAANKLGLTDTELDGITAGTIQVGDTNSGAITLSAAITSNTNLALTTGANGVISTGGSLGTTGATVTMNTTGPIGTSANRIQFADNTTTTQQNVVIGSTNQASSVYLDGLGSLTLGNISGGTANTTIDVTARTNLVVAASATINSGTSSNSLGADLTAAGAGDNGTGTLTVNASANVYGANITIRGADEDINSTANVGSNGVPANSTYIASGLSNPQGMVFDSLGNLYVSNNGGASATRVTPLLATSSYGSGFTFSTGIALDSLGNLYVAEGSGKIWKVPPGNGTPTLFATVGNAFGLVFDNSGNLYVANNVSGKVHRITTGGSVTDYATGLGTPYGLAFDSNGNLFVGSFNGNLYKVAPGGGVGTVFASGLGLPYGVAVDTANNIYVANYTGNSVLQVTPAAVVTTFASGFNRPVGLTFDSTGNLYVSNNSGQSVSKLTAAAVATNSLTVRSSLSSRPMSLGGGSVVGGINLSDAELGRIVTSSSGTVTIGDTAQTGDITFTTATAATTAGASTTVIQSTAGAGKIVLDDGANTGTALSGNGGVISLTAGTGGITATAANNTSAEISTTGATVTMNTTGPIGTSVNRIQFADNTTTTQQNVVIGSTNQASSVYLDGLGSLTLGSISGGIANTTIDVTARTNLVVAASATINSGTSTNSLGADLTAAGAGDNGTGTLTVNASANVLGVNITVRGADADVNATGNVGNAGTPLVSTLASGFLTFGVAFYNGNLYVADRDNNRVLQITPGGSSTVYATGFTTPRDVAFDSAGNMYVANFGGNSISKVAPGGGSSAVFATGFNSPQGITVDASDNIYVANAGNNLVSKVTVSAAGVFSAVNHSFSSPGATLQRVRFFSDGNLYASGTFGVKKINTATGVATAFVAASSNVYSDLAFDAATGVIYAIDGVFSTVYAINTSGAVSNYLTGNGLVNPATIARDPSGNLYVGNHVSSSLFKITPPTATQVIVRSSQSSRPMAIGGGSAVAGINLSDAELARFVTSSTGTITFGDTAQTGDITFTTATTATTAGASTTVIQSTAGAGKIVLDDGANTGTALNGNGGVISLTAGTGGITATAANNTSAEISTTAATVTLNTSGPIGTSANRIQFADNTNTAQQNVVIGSTTQASSVYLDGLGSLTLGSISGSTANTTIDVTTRTNLVVVGSATINSGTSSVSLGADLTAAGAGDNSVGTLSIGSGASVFAASMTLRGADVDIAGTANVGMAIASSTTTIIDVISTGLNSPRGAAFDSAGNLYVANQSGAITKVTFSSPGVVNQVVTNFATVGALPDWLVFDAAGNMYSANGAGTISKITFSSPGVLGTVNNSFISTGLNAPVALVFDSTGNLFIANYGNGKISKATFTSPGVFGTLSDFADLTSLGVTGAGSITIDPSNNLYVASNSKIVKVTPAGAASVIVASGITSDFTIAYFQGTLLAARSTTTLGQYSTSGTLLNASYATSLNTTWQTAPDSQGNLWVVNTGSNSVSKVVPNPTLTQLSLRPSVSSLPMSIGGTNNAVTGINLTDSELARIFSTSAGSIIFGDSSQTGDITFTTATVATTAGASTTVIQSASGAGKIVLDNSAGNGSALNGNSGNVSLTAGTGGIVEASTNTTAAADIVNAATTSLVSAGAIGTAILPVQIGATNLNTNSSTNNSNQFLRATGAVTIDATGVSAGTGTVTLVGGTVSLGGSNRIADATKLTVSGGTLAIGGFSDAVSTVTLKSGSITGSGGSLTSTNTIQTESGSVSAILAGANGLTQSTAGTTTLSGANTFTGTTTLSAGTLALSGASTNNIASTTSIDVQSGAILNVTGLTSGTLVLANGQTLKGQGTVTGKTTAANGSIVAPGASPGILNTGDITFNSGSTFSVELNGTSVGSLYDQLNVTGTVTINDGNLNVSLGYVPANGDSFVIVNNDSTDPVTVTNPFKVGGSPVPEGGSFILGGNRFVLTYAGGTNNNDVVLTVQNNTAPTAVVLSPSSASLAENASTAADTLLSTIAITDDGSGTNTLSLSGSDAESFRIVGNQLFLKAGVVLDFETKSSYTVRVNVDDTTVGGTPDAFVDFTLTITDVNEAPTAVVLTPASASLAEDVSTSSFTIVSTISITDDALGTNTLSLSGADAASFEIVAGKLRLKAGVVLDFETKSSYTVRVNVDDSTVGSTPDAFADFTLTITDVNEAPTAVVLTPTSASLAEDVSTSSFTIVSTISITDDALGTNTLSLSGADAASFEIVEGKLRLKAGVVLDFETKSSYSVRVNVDDTTVGGTPDAFVDFTLTITDVNEAPTALSLSPISAVLAENTNTASAPELSTITVTDDALGVNTLSLSGADAASFEIVAGKLRLKTGVVLDFETKSSYTVRVNVDDATVGGTPDAFADFVLSITDVAEDTTRPSSSVNALPLNATSLSIPITVTGFDPTGIEGPASGVKEYDLYVATAGGSFSKFATVSASSPTTVFTASSNQVYYFRSIARDNAGNVELDNGADAFIRVGDFDKPVSLVTSAVANSAGLFTITATGSDTGGGRVSRFDIYVSVDGGSATLVGSANAISNSGTLTYSGIVDGASHTYRFTSRAVDTTGNTEDAHTAADVTTTATFAAPASFQGTGIDVQLGATQRSYVRYVDVLFNDATGVSALTQANRVKVETFGLTVADVTAGTGATVPFTVVQIGGSNRLRLDFGVQGVGGARNSTAGDGFYRVRVDANGDGDYTDAGESFEFFRLLGDANGNAVIDALDTTVVDNLFGQIGTNLEGDLNGDGVVNTADKNFTLSRNRGRKLRDEWKSLLDD